MAVGGEVGGRDDDGSDRPPVDVARRGVHAANELVDRLVRSVDGDRDDTPDGARRNGESPDDGARDGPGASDDGAHFGAADDLLQAWIQVVRLGIDTFGRLRPGGGTGHERSATVPTIDTGGAASGVVRIEVGPSDAGPDAGPEVDAAEVWLHNRSTEPVAGLALHWGDLRASDGSVMPAAWVQVEPAVVDLPARSSRGIAVSLDADLTGVAGGPDLPAGTFRGVVLATGIADAWLPIEVVVSAPRHEG